MRTLRTLYRAFKVVMFVYGLFTALWRSRWFAAGLAIWRMLHREPERDVKKVANFTFVTAGEPAIYRRRGWRRLSVRRTRV